MRKLIVAKVKHISKETQGIIKAIRVLMEL
jgi:hypothetical protein